MNNLSDWFERVTCWLEYYCVHPDIIADPEKRGYNRLLFLMCLGIGGTRILMLLVMWGLTSDDRYAWNALQLHLLTYCGIILKFYPSIYKSALGLLCVGHLRYYYAFCVVDEPLISEALSALCIPIVSYYLAGRQAALYSTLFIGGTLTVFLNQGHSFDLSQSFEPYYFDLISVVWAIIGAGFVAGTYQNQRAKYHSTLLAKAQDMEALLQKNQQLMQTKQHFIAVSSHEIRNPLAVVLGRLELQAHREPWFDDLEHSLHGSQKALNTIMAEIKQTVRLNPTDFLVASHRLVDVLAVVEARLVQTGMTFQLEEQEAVCVGVESYQLAYVLFRLLHVNTSRQHVGQIEVMYHKNPPSIELCLPASLVCPTEEQIDFLKKTINDGRHVFDIIQKHERRIAVQWASLDQKAHHSA